MENTNTLGNMNKVIDNIIQSVRSGQDEIFSIYENAKNECERIKLELQLFKDKVVDIIREVEILENEEKKCRNKLFIVSKNFERYSEEDIKNAYQEATDAQVKLILKREEEKNLVKARNELEIRLKKNTELVEKAENYMYKMKSVMDFLVGDLQNVSKQLNLLEDKNQMGINIIKAQEEERRKIVRDIHDGPAQSLASLVLKSEMLEKIMDKDISLLKDEIKEMKNVIRDTLKDVRRIMYDLSPTSLDDLGLIPTIRRIISDITYDRGINIDLIELSNEKIYSPLVNVTVFRIIQESLNNAWKHSKCKNIKIKLDINKTNISAIVEDDGIGFKLSNDIISKNSFGIKFMKERVELLDGKLGIQSKEGQGTKIIFTIPNREVRYEGKD
ncbi:sensor histidine kinase [Alkalithermobacter paradoxus]|uniref:histidine kinase n=1 Tax=Alkalithermobacter paradoxus TaxID=29349 RepID=A0A1V4I7I0_9FIRM|nr:signal transduction histidine-protein kinase/phosphatase DegS [[Clostridium] thermoalcaliphilum]